MIIDTEDGNVKFNDVPIPDYERKRTEQKALRKEDNELSDFYMAETDAEREEKAPSYSAADLQEIKCRAFQALKRAPGIYSVQIGSLSDWFVCKVSKEVNDWPIGHPMAFEMTACLQPMMLANALVSTENLQDQMQTRGAFMLRVQENPNPSLWDIVFYLDTKFYCNVTMECIEGIPEVVLELFAKERERMAESLKPVDDFMDPQRRVRFVQQQEEIQMVRGVLTEEEEEEDLEEERLGKEEREAKDAAFRLGGVKARIRSFRLYLLGI